MLTGAEIDELLSSFNQAFPSRLRAYAMVRCLIDLGLRSSEVVKLQLDDINWADGTIKLVGTKSRRADALPLPSETGAAIAAYLHEERCSPCCPLRRADHDEERQTRSAGRLPKMWMDADRCPHSPPQHGEPTSARRRADEGDRGYPAASKPRHVPIYAKVDLTNLAAVALPWPGSAQ
nr:tyrosine-type recombinase/integrase [Mesorhizobium sp.]